MNLSSFDFRREEDEDRHTKLLLSNLTTQINLPGKDLKLFSSRELKEIMPVFGKKASHRRTQSMPDHVSAAVASKSLFGSTTPLTSPNPYKTGRSSLPNSPKNDSSTTASPHTRRFSMYPSLVADLMDLTKEHHQAKTSSSSSSPTGSVTEEDLSSSLCFLSPTPNATHPLQIPSLAKPSPTSFLTGNESQTTTLTKSHLYDDDPHQITLPVQEDLVTATKLCQFVESYREQDLNFDPSSWISKSRLELRQVQDEPHKTMAQHLLQVGPSITEIAGFVCSRDEHKNPLSSDHRTEIVIIEGQRQFWVICRAPTADQNKPQSTVNHKKTVDLDQHHLKGIPQHYHQLYAPLEVELFQTLGQIMEDNPFCDVSFSGFSTGGALAQLAALRYAQARPQLRMSCFPVGAPSIATTEIVPQWVRSSLPNLKVVSTLLTGDPKAPSSGNTVSVGHSMVLCGDTANCYKWQAPPSTKIKKKKPSLLKVVHHKHHHKNTVFSIQAYCKAVEELKDECWPTEFCGMTPQGVVGLDNEERQVV